jgi:uncharacterized membrane protein
MKIIELLRKTFVVLMLSFAAMAILPACSSSEEESSGGGECGDTSHCAAGDVDCKEAAMQACDV